MTHAPLLMLDADESYSHMIMLLLMLDADDSCLITDVGC